MGESWEISRGKKIKNQRYNISSDGVIEGVRTDQEILQLHFFVHHNDSQFSYLLLTLFCNYRQKKEQLILKSKNVKYLVKS